MSSEPILIDGAQGEGGGQVLRTSLGLAAALGQGLRIVNIRARRKPSGLRPQHVAAVRAAAAVCDAEVRGAAVGAGELTFLPGRPRGGSYEFDIGTAGSTSLVLQTIIPPLMVCGDDAEVVVRGGTHNPFAPCFHYLRDVFGLLASAMGLQAYFQMNRAGFYPKGGGEVAMHVRGLAGREDLAPVRYESRGELDRIEVLSATGGDLPEHIVDRQAKRAVRRLLAPGRRVDVQQERWDTLSPGTTVFVRAVFSRTVGGFDALGARGKPAERVADEAVDAMLAFLDGDGALDPHAADQILTLAALCPEESRFTCSEATDHLRTNAAVIAQLTGRDVRIDQVEGTAAVTVAPL
ncbi:MAG TPA: RNA 3'-terminal phosphate cyclase [Phycisphaerae bacterium]|nr:RNA 3'-terminal phosphate cyclase [Phycisphaerae bacterium]